MNVRKKRAGEVWKKAKYVVYEHSLPCTKCGADVGELCQNNAAKPICDARMKLWLALGRPKEPLTALEIAVYLSQHASGGAS